MEPGILNLYKPPGISSNFFLTKIKKNLPKEYLKIGHFGTLDPFACGVLLIGHNGTQRLNSYINEMPKTYLAVGSCVGATSTGDKTEEIINFSDVHFLKEYFNMPAEIKNNYTSTLLGEYWQAPPVFSAAKFQGKSLYKWARKGKIITKEKQKRNIYQFEIVRERMPYILFKVTVSSGTYVRTLFEDYCKNFGLQGHLISLIRLSIGDFKVCDSLKLENIRSGHIVGTNPSKVISFPEVTLDELQKHKFTHGAYVFDRFAISNHQVGQYLWALDADGQSLGLGCIGLSEERIVLKPLINWIKSEVLN